MWGRIALLAVVVLALFAAPAGAVTPAADITGSWEATGGGPPWQLDAVNGGQDLDATWTGGAGHSHLHGSFQGTLTSATTYFGHFHITEDMTMVDGTITWTIVSANQVKAELSPGGTITFNRAGGGKAVSAEPITQVPPAAGYDQFTSTPAPAPGGAVTTSSPPLGQNTAVTEDVSGVTVADQAMFTAGKQICYEHFVRAILNVDLNQSYGLSSNKRSIYLVDANVPRALADLSFCIEFMKALVAATHAQPAVARNAAAGCSFAGIRYTLSRKRTLKHLAFGGKLHVSCKYTAQGLEIHYRTGSKKPLSSIVGPRLQVAVLRASSDPAGGTLSFAFHKG